MILEVTEKEYMRRMGEAPHFFISEEFVNLNINKVDRIIRLIEDKPKVNLGLVVGLKNNILLSPFSAPFGGFHIRNQDIYISEIENFLFELEEYMTKEKISKFCVTLPPFLYQQSFNSKLINVLIRIGYKINIPEITNWIPLVEFNGEYGNRKSKEYYRQAVKNNLKFYKITDELLKQNAFSLIENNRKKFNRPIYMTFQDLKNMEAIVPVDYFIVVDANENILSSGIFYRFNNEIVYAVFWGDNELGRPLRAMDFLIYNLITFYKNEENKFIDLGISTESGIPNEGLLRFKETHESLSSLRYSFEWTNNLL